MSLLTELYEATEDLTKEQQTKVEEVGKKFEGIINKLRRDLVEKDPNYREVINKINRGDAEVNLKYYSLLIVFRNHENDDRITHWPEIFKNKERVEIIKRGLKDIFDLCYYETPDIVEIEYVKYSAGLENIEGEED
jgi:hypothetical protein